MLLRRHTFAVIDVLLYSSMSTRERHHQAHCDYRLKKRYYYIRFAITTDVSQRGPGFFPQGRACAITSGSFDAQMPKFAEGVSLMSSIRKRTLTTKL